MINISELCYDRTADDVKNAKEIVKNNALKTLTTEQNKTVERGYFTLTVLNRIENMELELYETLKEYGYETDCLVRSKDYWDKSKIVHSNDYKRMLDNLNKLKRGFIYLKNGTTTPLEMKSYTHLNDVEKILADIAELFNGMINSTTYASDEYYCGGVI